MSASRKKQERKLAEAPEISAREQEEMIKEAQRKRNTIVYSIIGVVVVILAAILLIWDSGVFQRNATVATIDGEKVIPAQVAFHYYNNPLSSTAAQYAQYGMTMPYSPNKSPKDQVIKAADIVSLEDWRGKGVSLNENDAYRGYYGVNPVISLSADKPVTCNMVVEGVLKTIALPSHIKSGIVTSDMVDGTIIDDSMVGTYFYYRNNGSTVDKDFSINFYVDVEYFWGTLSTSQVTVPVKATQRVNAPASK